MGQWAVYNTSPQSFIVTLSDSLAKPLWGLLFNFDWLVRLVECSNFQILILIGRKSDIVCHNWGRT